MQPFSFQIVFWSGYFMTATETKLGQAPPNSAFVTRAQAPLFLLSLGFTKKGQETFRNAGCTSFALSPRYPLSACVHEARFQLVAKKQDTWHLKETQCGPNHGSLPFFFICWLRAKWLTASSLWGAQPRPYFSGKQTPKHLERSFGPWTVPVAVNRLWSLWNILGLSFRSLSKLLTSLLPVKRQTGLSSELTWHWDMACLSLWLSSTLPDLLLTSSLLSCPRLPLDPCCSAFNGRYCHTSESQLSPGA